ncbi:MAG TPA: hypothetical protein VMN39_09195 [Longimicrobiaceae bacterium]|nr:hypothetical protein [Longimicrobiaceae bacterium]
MIAPPEDGLAEPPAPGKPAPAGVDSTDGTARCGSAADPLAFRYEFARKGIHLATVAVPIAVWFLPSAWAFGLLLTGMLGALAVEWARARVRWARHVFLTGTRRLLRAHERKGLAGATYMAIAYLLAYLIFPLHVAVAAMLYAALGDAAAALVGKRWGRHRTGNGKSWEGAAGGFAVNVVIGTAIPGLLVLPAAMGAAAAALVELAPIEIDDNLLVTLVGGAGLWAATAIL